MKAVTKAGSPKGAHGSQGMRASTPASQSLRVHPTVHAKAPKSKTTGAIPSFPNASQMSPSGPRTIRGSA
jgi:hypothetical protein